MVSRGRVLHVGPLPPPSTGMGGMAGTVARLSQGLAPVLAVRVLDTGARQPAGGAPGRLRLLWQLAALCLRWRPALVHVHTGVHSNPCHGATEVALARLLGRRVVLQLHGAGYAGFLAGLGPLRAAGARAALRLAHRVVVPARFARAPLAPWVALQRVVVVPEGVAPDAPVTPRQDGVFRIAGLAGRAGNAKALADLLRAVALLPQPERVRVQLAGVDADDGAQAELQRLASLLGLAGQVEVAGRLAGAQRAAWLRRADCLCLPAPLQASLPPMLAAMAIALPLVVAEGDAATELLRHGRDGLLFTPGDLAALARQLQHLVADPGLRQAIGRQGRLRLVAEFSIDTSVRRLRRLYGMLAPALAVDGSGLR